MEEVTEQLLEETDQEDAAPVQWPLGALKMLLHTLECDTSVKMRRAAMKVLCKVAVCFQH